MKNTLIISILLIVISTNSYSQLNGFSMAHYYQDADGSNIDNSFDVCLGDKIYIVNSSSYTNQNGSQPIGNNLTTGYYRLHQYAPQFQVLGQINASDWGSGEVWELQINTVFDGDVALTYIGNGVIPLFPDANSSQRDGRCRPAGTPGFLIKNCEGEFVETTNDGTPIQVCPKDIIMKKTSTACTGNFHISIMECNIDWIRTNQNTWGSWFIETGSEYYDLAEMTDDITSQPAVNNNHAGHFEMECGNITQSTVPGLHGQPRYYWIKLAYGPVWTETSVIIELKCNNECCCNMFDEVGGGIVTPVPVYPKISKDFIKSPIVPKKVLDRRKTRKNK